MLKERVHALKDASGKEEAWVECGEEEWTSQLEENRKMLMPGGFHQGAPVRVRRVRAGECWEE